MQVLHDSRSMPTSEKLIRAARARSNAGNAVQDLDAIAGVWMEDVCVVGRHGGVIRGKAENRHLMAEHFSLRADTLFVRTPSSVDVFEPWLVAAERGGWTGTWTEPDGPLKIEGAYQAQWRKIDGVWLLQAELYVPTSCIGGSYCQSRPNTGILT